MASFSDIINAAQQGQQAPAAPMPYVPQMPGVQTPVPQQMPEIQQMPQAQAQPQPQANPEPAPEELEQNKNAWRPVIENFMSQPGAQQALMVIGMKLLAGRRPGQSIGSQLGEAAGTGMVMHQMGKDNAAAAAEKARERGMEDQKFNLEMRKGTAQADKAESENDFYGKTRTQALEEINLGIANLKTKGKVDEAKLVEQEFENGNLKKAWEMTVAEKNLEMADKRSSMWARGEQVKIARHNANKVPAVGQAKKDQEDLVRRANPIVAGETPQAYDQRIAQATLGIQGTGKSNSAADWTKYAEGLEEGPERDAALAEAKAILTGRKAPAAPVATGLGAGPGRATVANPKADWIKRAQAANPGMPLAEIQQRATVKFGK